MVYILYIFAEQRVIEVAVSLLRAVGEVMGKQKAKDREKAPSKWHGVVAKVRHKETHRGGFPFPDQNPHPVLRISAGGKVLYSNDASKILLRAWQCESFKILPEKWNRYVQTAISERQRQQAEVEVEERIFTVTFVPSSSGDYVNVYGFDISEEKKALKALTDSEQRFRSLAATAVDAIISADIHGNIIQWNAGAERMFDYSDDEIIGQPLTKIMPERYRHAHLKGVNRLAETGKTRLSNRVVEVAGLRRDGSEFPLELTVSKWQTGEGVFFTSILRDTTKQQEALQSLNLRNSAIFQSTNIIIIAQNIEVSENPITYVNPSFERVTGYSLAEVLGKDCRFLQGEDNDQPGLDEIRQALKEQHACKTVVRNYRKDGSMFWNEISISPVFDDQNNLTHYVAVTNDITERKQSEHQRENLMNSLEDKSRDMTSLLRIVTHDLRSPLVNVDGYSKELLTDCQKLLEVIDKLEMDEQMRKDISAIIDEYIPQSLSFIKVSVSKMEALLSSLNKLATAGRIELQIESLDMNEVVGDVIDGMQFQAKEKKATINLGPLPDCFGDEGQISQVFSNLIGNAVKYLESDREGIVRIWGKVEGHVSKYCVEDNGIGVPEKHQQKVFEIFHRVDPKSHIAGDGMGLATAKQIIDRHNGRIWLESEPGEGSKFFITLSTYSNS